MNILITGGAGYIGSHVAKQLLEATQHDITVLDNLSTGYIQTIQTLRAIRDFEFVELDLKEFDAVNILLKTKSFAVIIHFTASSVVAESVENPLKYYMNNTVNTTNLIKCASEYGMSKLMSEKVLQDTACVNSNLNYVIFRYFNVSGSDMFYENEKLMPRIGECHESEINLIPLVIKIALKKRNILNT